MLDDVEFVRFVADRYSRLHGYGAVVAAAGLVALALMLTRPWGSNEWAIVAGMAVAVIVAAILVSRYYTRVFGCVTSNHKEREPWYAAVVIGLLESSARHFRGGEDGRGAETGVLALGLAGVFFFHAWKDWRFRKHASLPALALLYLGLDRLIVNQDVDFWVWAQRALMIVAVSIAVTGFADHQLVKRALSPSHRGLAMSGALLPSGSALPAVARDPSSAIILTALEACEEADVTFLGNIAGVPASYAAARVEEFRQLDLAIVEERGTRFRPLTFARLTPGGHDIARSLWD